MLLKVPSVAHMGILGIATAPAQASRSWVAWLWNHVRTVKGSLQSVCMKPLSSWPSIGMNCSNGFQCIYLLQIKLVSPVFLFFFFNLFVVRLSYLDWIIYDGCCNFYMKRICTGALQLGGGDCRFHWELDRWSVWQVIAEPSGGYWVPRCRSIRKPGHVSACFYLSLFAERCHHLSLKFQNLRRVKPFC